MFQKIYTIFRIYKISDQLQFTQCSFRFITEFLTKQGTKSKTGTCFCCTIIMLYRINYYIYYIQMNIRKRCITNYSKTNTTRNCVHKFDNFFRLQNNFLISPGPADRLTIYDSSVTGQPGKTTEIICSVRSQSKMASQINYSIFRCNGSYDADCSMSLHNELPNGKRYCQLQTQLKDNFCFSRIQKMTKQKKQFFFWDSRNHNCAI